MKTEKMQEQVLLQIDELEERIAPDGIGGTPGNRPEQQQRSWNGGFRRCKTST